MCAADEDGGQLEEERRSKEALRREQAARRAATTALANLGVIVRDGQVFKHTFAAVRRRDGDSASVGSPGHMLKSAAGGVGTAVAAS